jgi:hypothetical protein
MLSHPLAVRSARHAALSGRNKLRKNFFRPVSFETIFAFGRAAVRHRTFRCICRRSYTARTAQIFYATALERTSARSSYINGAALERLAVGRVAFAKRFGVLLP